MPGEGVYEESSGDRAAAPSRLRLGADATAAAVQPGDPSAVVHVPILLREVLECLRPRSGDVVADCTLGGGGHARAILAAVRPGGRVIGLDVDPIELPRTQSRLREEGVGSGEFVARCMNFSSLPIALAAEGLAAADVVLADLGVSSMQLDRPERGFSYKGVGPLDMRMNPLEGETAAELIARVPEEELAQLLHENADEPHAQLIARVLKQHLCETTHATERAIRGALHSADPALSKSDVKMSTRRTFQALRIAVNNEFAALDALLGTLPCCLAPGGRVAIITFHSGEDRRVKKAFQAGRRSGAYVAIADHVIRSQKEETFSNRRASAAKLRWAERARHHGAATIR